MTGTSSWRDLRSVMLLTAHVAAAAYIIRSLGGAATSAGPSLAWLVPATIGVAVFLSWPIARALSSAFDPGDLGADRACPRCGRREIRPLIRPGVGLFQAASGYRCAACWTTLRRGPDGGMEMQGPPGGGPIDSSGIAYPSDPLDEGEIRFLEDGEPGRE